jgi:hypothetical protein
LGPIPNPQSPIPKNHAKPSNEIKFVLKKYLFLLNILIIKFMYTFLI